MSMCNARLSNNYHIFIIKPTHDLKEMKRNHTTNTSQESHPHLPSQGIYNQVDPLPFMKMTLPRVF